MPKSLPDGSARRLRQFFSQHTSVALAVKPGGQPCSRFLPPPVTAPGSPNESIASRKDAWTSAPLLTHGVLSPSVPLARPQERPLNPWTVRLRALPPGRGSGGQPRCHRALPPSSEASGAAVPVVTSVTGLVTSFEASTTTVRHHAAEACSRSLTGASPCSNINYRYTLSASIGYLDKTRDQKVASLNFAAPSL